VRFALDLDVSSKYGHDVTLAQVERHMRLCVAATAHLKQLFTASGSEPFLAEVARQLMADSGADPVRHLMENESLRCVQLSPRAELLAVLIIMRARDTAAGDDRRWVPVDDFFRALFPVSVYERLRCSKPAHWRRQGEEDNLFRGAFEGYCMWFNHVINVQDTAMVNREHLWKFITRGAMVVCAKPQTGINIVLPLCKRDKKLSRSSVSAILIQVNVHEHFLYPIDQTLFDLMDPFDVFSDPPTAAAPPPPPPVIRMVFALGSDEPGVFFGTDPAHGHGHGDGNGFTSYDIWCAGLSQNTFRDIDAGGALSSYQKLLCRCLRPREVWDLAADEDMYWDEDTAVARAEQRRAMMPLSWQDARLSV